MKSLLIAALAATALPAIVLPAAAVSPVAETPVTNAAPTPGEIIATAGAGDWADIAPTDLLVMTLAPDMQGRPRRVIIELMPPPFSQGWIGNIRQLASAHWWDGTSINRVQDNYVTQWGDATEKKPLPGGLTTVPQSDYVATLPPRPISKGKAVSGGVFPRLRSDAYAPITGFIQGWPVGSEAATKGGDRVWPVHCYGMVGVGRDLPPDTGTGAELYTVIGHAPRHLDRNIALVGRVIDGMEYLSSLPRGTGALGFYETAGERVPITSVRLASELPPADQPHFQYLSNESDSFARYFEARTNRRDAFFVRPAGGADICNVPVPIRRRP